MVVPRRRWIILGGALFAGCATPGAPVPTSASPASAGEDVCKVVPCRPALEFRLHDNAGNQFVTNVPPTPYAGDGIAVYPGDDFFVAADEANGTLNNFRYIDPPATPKDVIRVGFVQEEKNGQYTMVLTLQSYFARPLLYHALAHDAPRPQREYFKTTTCPILTRVRAIEMWPQAVTFLKLQDFRFGQGTEPCAYY